MLGADVGDSHSAEGGLFAELIACDMSLEASKLCGIVTTISMLLKDVNERSLKGIDLLVSFEKKNRAFR